MKHKIENIGASVQERLRQRAKKDGADVEIYLVRYAYERLLHRLCQSEYRDSLVLKGAMLQTIWLDGLLRATRDIDFLAFGDIEAESVFRKILSTKADDGVIFDVGNMSIAPIQEEKDYSGFRLEAGASIGTAKVNIKIDLGFGDAVHPEPVEIDFPTLIGSPKPRIRAYPKETVVAEKLQAIVALGRVNTRMKDYYDLWLMIRCLEFDESTLAKSIATTFSNRNTALPEDAPAGLGKEFVADTGANRLWENFKSRNVLDPPPPNLSKTVAVLRDFFMPVFHLALERKVERIGGASDDLSLG